MGLYGAAIGLYSFLALFNVKMISILDFSNDMEVLAFTVLFAPALAMWCFGVYYASKRLGMSIAEVKRWK